jgi:hypothetical protein
VDRPGDKSSNVTAFRIFYPRKRHHFKLSVSQAALKVVKKRFLDAMVEFGWTLIRRPPFVPPFRSSESASPACPWGIWWWRKLRSAKIRCARPTAELRRSFLRAKTHDHPVGQFGQFGVWDGILPIDVAENLNRHLLQITGGALWRAGSFDTWKASANLPEGVGIRLPESAAPRHITLAIFH